MKKYKQNTILAILLFAALAGCGVYKNKNKKRQVLCKYDYIFENRFQDSCLYEKRVFFSPEDYNKLYYFSCDTINNIAYYKEYRNSKITYESDFNDEGRPAWISLCKYDENGYLYQYLFHDPERDSTLNYKVNNIFDTNGHLIKQCYISVNGDTMQQITYKWNGNIIAFKSEKGVLFSGDTYYNKKGKPIKWDNGFIQEYWEYDNEGKLIKYKKNKYKSWIYSYKNGNLVKKQSIITLKDTIKLREYFIYEYYDNDSIKSISEYNKNGKLRSLNKFYYKYEIFDENKHSYKFIDFE